MSFKRLLQRAKSNGIKLLVSIKLLGILFVFSLVVYNWYRLSEEIGIAITYSSLAIASLQPRSPHKPSSPVFESNATHLWSIRLADKDYFHLARRLPCRVVVYVGGPSNDIVNSCDHSLTSEFSVETTLKAQKWLFDHQHPHSCSNKSVAIINNYALSGLGSTLHQIVSALSKALSEGRIAVYASPGNWVRLQRMGCSVWYWIVSYERRFWKNDCAHKNLDIACRSIWDLQLQPWVFSVHHAGIQ